MYHDFVGNWFSHSTEKVRRGTPHFSEKYFYRKSSSIGGGYHDLLPKLFCLSVPEKNVGDSLSLRKFLVSEILKDKSGLSFITVENFVPHSAGKFLRGAFLCQKISGLKKLHKMVYHNFVENWFSHSTEKLLRGTLHFSENLLYRKRFRIGGGYHDILSKHFVSQYRENS